MTFSPDAPHPRFTNLAEAVVAVRSSGLRLSTARRLILEGLFAAEGPVSAVHLARTLSIDESSVYRNLEVLEARGLVRHVHLGHGPGLYVLLGRKEQEYLCCSRCSQVTALAPDRLDPIRDQIKREFGYETRFTHFAMVGLCQRCAAGSAAGSIDERPHGHTHSHGDFVHSHPHADAQAAFRHEH